MSGTPTYDELADALIAWVEAEEDCNAAGETPLAAAEARMAAGELVARLFRCRYTVGVE